MMNFTVFFVNLTIYSQHEQDKRKHDKVNYLIYLDAYEY